MIRARSVEIHIPDQNVLVVIENALFAEEAATMEKMTELRELTHDILYELGEHTSEDWLKGEISQWQKHLVSIRASLAWTRYMRVLLFRDGVNDAQ